MGSEETGKKERTFIRIVPIPGNARVTHNVMEGWVGKGHNSRRDRRQEEEWREGTS